MIARLKKLFGRTPTETPLERWARAFPPERLAAIAEKGTDNAIAASLGTLSVTTGLELLRMLREQRLTEYLSALNPDVVLFEACAFLLGIGHEAICPTDSELDWALEPSSPESRIILAKHAASAAFDEYTEFQEPIKLLVGRESRYRKDVATATENLVVALGHLERQQVPHRVIPKHFPLSGDFKQVVFLRPATMIWVASFGDYFANVARTLCTQEP